MEFERDPKIGNTKTPKDTEGRPREKVSGPQDSVLSTVSVFQKELFKNI